MKNKMRDAYMDTAYRFASLSSAVRLKVGSIIVKDDRIISIGFNGTPSGWDNNCEDKEYMPWTGQEYHSQEEIEADWPYNDQIDKEQDKWRRYRLVTRPEVLHAEQNALMKLAKSTESGNNATLFVTHAPCLQCAKNIYQAGISEVFVGEHYRDTSGIDFLKKCEIPVSVLN